MEFFAQILGADGSCQEIVRKIQAYAATKSKRVIPSSMSAYSQARQKLDIGMLETILSEMSPPTSFSNDKSMNNRRVLVVD